MELAKIRTKSRQEASDDTGRMPASDAVQVETGTETPPALSLSDTLPDDLFDMPNALISFPGPAPVRSAVSASRLDPLSRILAGREQNRVAADSVDEVPDRQAPAEAAYEEFLCIQLGIEEYGINIMEIKEIIKPRELTEVPRAPGFVDGVLSLRGVIVPVFALRKRLGMQLEYDNSLERIVIVRCGDGLYGLRVDRVIDVLKIASGTREPAPPVLEGIAREFVSGIGRTVSRMIILLDIAKVADIALGEVA